MGLPVDSDGGEAGQLLRSELSCLLYLSGSKRSIPLTHLQFDLVCPSPAAAMRHIRPAKRCHVAYVQVKYWLRLLEAERVARRFKFLPSAPSCEPETWILW